MKKLIELFLTMLKIGTFTFGGGYSMIAFLESELVEKKKWIERDDFLNMIAIAESTPGPIAINMATFIGASQQGFVGSLVATIGVVLPSFIIILLVATILRKLIKNKYFQAFMSGVKPVVIGLIVSTGIVLLFKSIGFDSTSRQFLLNLPSLIVFSIIVLLFVATKLMFNKKIGNISIIILAAALGIGICMLMEHI